MATQREILEFIEVHAPVSYQDISKHVHVGKAGTRSGISNILYALAKKGKIEKVNLPDGPKYILASKEN